MIMIIVFYTEVYILHDYVIKFWIMKFYCTVCCHSLQVDLFQRPWDFWPNFRSIYWMKWETRFSRLNPIIRLIFPVGKKGQLGKKILFYVLQVYDIFFFFFTIINKYLI